MWHCDVACAFHLPPRSGIHLYAYVFTCSTPPLFSNAMLFAQEILRFVLCVNKCHVLSSRTFAVMTALWKNVVLFQMCRILGTKHVGMERLRKPAGFQLMKRPACLALDLRRDLRTRHSPASFRMSVSSGFLTNRTRSYINSVRPLANSVSC